MKRILCLFLAIVCCLAFCSCGSSERDRDNDNDNTSKTSSKSSSKSKKVPEGHWELDKMDFEKNNDTSDSKSKTVYSVTQTSHTLEYAFMGSSYENAFSGKYVITCNDMPDSFEVGDTVSMQLKAKAASYTDKKTDIGFYGYADFEANLEFFNDGFAEGKKGVSAGMDRNTYPSGFNTHEERTYEKVLGKKYAGKLDYFWLKLITDAGQSSWRYKWVGEKADDEDENGLSSKNIEGSYEVSGTWTAHVYTFDEPETKTMSTTVTVKAVSETEIEMTLGNMQMTPGPYDPKTGKVEFYNKVYGPYYAQFTEENGNIKLEINWDYKREESESKGKYTGYKS